MLSSVNGQGIYAFSKSSSACASCHHPFIVIFIRNAQRLIRLANSSYLSCSPTCYVSGCLPCWTHASSSGFFCRCHAPEKFSMILGSYPYGKKTLLALALYYYTCGEISGILWMLEIVDCRVKINKVERQKCLFEHIMKTPVENSYIVHFRCICFGYCAGFTGLTAWMCLKLPAKLCYDSTPFLSACGVANPVLYDVPHPIYDSGDRPSCYC